jgi:LAO/AO transport system kinase
MIAGGGDELQGIKKGVLEVAEAIVINKADGDNIARAELARKEYETALHLLMPYSPNWTVPVLTCSALQMVGGDIKSANVFFRVDLDSTQFSPGIRLMDTD